MKITVVKRIVKLNGFKITKKNIQNIIKNIMNKTKKNYFKVKKINVYKEGLKNKKSKKY